MRDDEYFYGPPLTEFREEFEGILPKFEKRWIGNLSEFLGACSGLRQLENRLEKLPSILLQAEGALELLNENPPIEDWESFKEFWLEEVAINAPIVPLDNFARNPPKIERRSPTESPPKEYLPGSSFPIRNQGSKKTCVAHALASLIEHYTGKAVDAATTQRIFDESLVVDGIKAKGALLSVALSRARDLKLWDGERVVHPNDPESWKETLFGVDGVKPSPIIAAFGTFASWLYSKSAFFSGKWTLPLPEEPCVGGHAVLIVGYKDDARVPGDGYFVARNSWGEEYACKSRIKRPGHALIPYAYVQKYCSEAYAARLEIRNDSKRKYVRALERDARDLRGINVSAGTEAIAHPNEPDRFLVCAKRDLDPDKDNWNFFRENGFAWTRAQLVRNFFPAFDDAFRALVDARLAGAQAFMNGAKTNLDRIVGVESPFSPRGVLTSAKKFRVVEEIADLSESVQRALAFANGLRRDVKAVEDRSIQDVNLFEIAPEEWKNAFKASAFAKIWRVDDGKKAVAVAALWLVPIRFSPIEPPTFEAPTAKTLEIALNVVDEFIDERKGEKFETICKSFGTFEGSWQGLEGVARGVPYAFSTFESGRWLTTTCESVVDERTRALVPYLRPTTLDATTALVKSVLERERFFRGDFTVEFVARKSETASSEVAAAFDELAKNGEYEIYKTARGELACRKRG